MQTIWQKQTIKITFWAKDEDTANKVFEYVYDKHIDKGTNEELEFMHFDTNAYDEGGECLCVYTHDAPCEYYPGDYWEPDDWSYPSFIDEDEPADWFNEYNTEVEEDTVSDVMCIESIDDSNYDGTDY